MVISIQIKAQHYPQFDSPVKHKIALSGSFGELRTGHFHAGIDIRSKRGIEGDSIFTIAAGYVSRIKVEPGGYGYSLYIDHPSGYTSVYAHLKNFEKSIDEYVYQIQSDEQCFTVDDIPPLEAFPLAKGQYIGQMGNTGKSLGAHLHFEIRLTENDKLINPLLCGIKPTDYKNPNFKSLTVYEYDDVQQIINEQVYEIKEESSDLYSVPDTINLKNIHHSELSVKLYDSMNGSKNKNGIYTLKVYSKKQLIQEICFNTMEFDDSNAIDYLLDKKIKAEKNINQYLIPLNDLALPFSFLKLDSTLSMPDYQSLIIEASDIDGNTSKLKVNLKNNQGAKPIHTSVYNYVCHADKQTLIHLKNFDLRFPAHTFLSRQGIFVKEINRSYKAASDHDLLILGPAYVKLNKPINLQYRSNQTRLTGKHCLVRATDQGDLNLMSQCSSGFICSASLTSLDNIMLMEDTIPPSITPLFSHKTISPKSYISFHIVDNIIPISKRHFLRYEATLNGGWILFNYDLKTDIISHKVKDSIKRGKYFLELQVTDNQENTNCYSTELTIK